MKNDLSVNESERARGKIFHTRKDSALVTVSIYTMKHRVYNIASRLIPAIC